MWNKIVTAIFGHSLSRITADFDSAVKRLDALVEHRDNKAAEITAMISQLKTERSVHEVEVMSALAIRNRLASIVAITPADAQF